MRIMYIILVYIYIHIYIYIYISTHICIVFVFLTMSSLILARYACKHTTRWRSKNYGLIRFDIVVYINIYTNIYIYIYGGIYIVYMCLSMCLMLRSMLECCVSVGFGKEKRRRARTTSPLFVLISS